MCGNIRNKFGQRETDIRRQNHDLMQAKFFNIPFLKESLPLPSARECFTLVYHTMYGILGYIVSTQCGKTRKSP